MKLSVNISATGLASPAELKVAGTTHVRIPLWPAHDMRSIVQTLVSGGIEVLPCADSQTLSVARDPIEQARYWNTRIGDLCKTIQWGANEFDQQGSTSSTTPEPVVYEQLKAARAVFVGHPLVGPNCASGQPDRWTQRLDEQVDAVCLSRYPPNAAQMADGIYGPQGYKRFGSPVWITEFPWWSQQHASEALRLSEGPAYVYNWRSWHQSQDAYWHDGLLDLAGMPTWRYDAFKKMAAQPEQGYTELQQALMFRSSKRR